MLSFVNIVLLYTGKTLVKLWQVLLFTLACGLLWEFGTLLVPEGISGLPSATLDPIDFVFYFAGGLLFWLVNKANKA